MSYLEEMLAFNQRFVAEKQYEPYCSTKYPDKKMAIVSCMDARLTELLPAALNIKNGDIKMIKNAGALITNPFGSAMRSLLIAVYELGVEDILVIGHHDCGMQNLKAEQMTAKMIKRGIDPEMIHLVRYCGTDLEGWLEGFGKVETSVEKTVELILTHPLMPKDIRVHGFTIDPVSGKLEQIISSVSDSRKDKQ